MDDEITHINTSLTPPAPEFLELDDYNKEVGEQKKYNKKRDALLAKELQAFNQEIAKMPNLNVSKNDLNCSGKTWCRSGRTRCASLGDTMRIPFSSANAARGTRQPISIPL